MLLLGAPMKSLTLFTSRGGNGGGPEQATVDLPASICYG
jgi:hypothetical protein